MHYIFLFIYILIICLEHHDSTLLLTKHWNVYNLSLVFFFFFFFFLSPFNLFFNTILKSNTVYPNVANFSCKFTFPKYCQDVEVLLLNGVLILV